MVKKFASLAAAGAMLLALATPSLAWWGGWGGDRAIVRNGASASANTGDNDQGNYVITRGSVDDTTVSGDNTMVTGDARAKAKAGVLVNQDLGCGVCGPRRDRDYADVTNTANASANTGRNTQGNGVISDGSVDDTDVSGNNSMTTGDASAKSKAFAVVNSDWSWSI